MCQQNQINVNSCMFKKMRRFLSADIRGFVTILEVHQGVVFEKHFLCVVLHLVSAKCYLPQSNE